MKSSYENSVLRDIVNNFLRNQKVTKTDLSNNIDLSRQSITKYLSNNSVNFIPDSFINRLENYFELPEGYFFAVVNDTIIERTDDDSPESKQNNDEIDFHEMMVKLFSQYKRAQSEVRARVERTVKLHFMSQLVRMSKRPDGTILVNDKPVTFQFVFAEPHYTNSATTVSDVLKHDYIIENLHDNEIRVVYHAFNSEPCIYVFDVEEAFKGLRSVPVETINGKLYDHNRKPLEFYRI